MGKSFTIENNAIKGLEFDHKFFLSSDDILNLVNLPKSILIVGSGAIGIEWARIFSNFGVETTVVELASHLLPLADIEVSKRVERIFKANKIKFYTQTSVKEIADKTVILSNDEILLPIKSVKKSISISVNSIFKFGTPPST